MSDDQHLEGNEESTPIEESETDETSDEGVVYAEAEDDFIVDEEPPVTREDLKRLEKGIQALATRIGREKPAEKATEPASVIKNLYFKANPEAQEIWAEVEKEAKSLNKDPFDLYESSAYFKGEAKARAEAKKVSEENKGKINKPFSGTNPKPVDISSIKPEDVHGLSPKQKVEWLKNQADKERNSVD